MSDYNIAKLRLREQARRLSSAMLDLLFPPRCAVCRRPGDAPLCAACIESFSPLTQAVCRKCCLPMEKPGICDRCRVNPLIVSQVSSVYRYEGAVRKAVIALKFDGRSELASLLADLICSHLPPPTGVALCAVPMHPHRLKERGYNHAFLLARSMAERWQMDLLPQSTLERVRHTPQQVGQGYGQRVEQVQGAFAAGEQVRGQSVALVDDVCTTGATLNACAQALMQSGAANVIGITLARTPWDTSA